jgi:UDP-N-acetylglucosamine--N-acetylmuramyl-(pentapeptide) pyrophosphoryl-undecaprenol N-acetylglucosamine transferase
MKIILSGGGTGGHIYPAVAVAEALKRRLGSGVELLFVGAEGKMEMEKIPALGYRIEGLPVAGLQRRLDMRNLLLPIKIARSLAKARRVIREFGADVVVGFGGYASAPVLRAAQSMKIPTVIQEQNSYAGLTNKLLARRARKICVAYEGMERFFAPEKIVMTGNPLRGNFTTLAGAVSGVAGISGAVAGASSGASSGAEKLAAKRAEALEYFGFSAAKPVVLVVGGSLGSRTFNEMMKRHARHLVERADVQIIWQTGKFYEAEMREFMLSNFGENGPANIWWGAFIDRMDLAYAAADLVISRSGAITVSELCLLGKAVMFVPSPNVAEDHQAKNAMALVKHGAAEICPDNQAVERAIPTALDLVFDREKLELLAGNIRLLGVPDSADRVAEIVLQNG